MDDLLLRYLHFIGIFILASALLSELLLIKTEMTRNEFQRLVITDRLYGISSVIVLLAGLSLWFWVGKPADFYTYNVIFIIKISIFVLIGLASIYPTKFIISNSRSQHQTISIPRPVILIVRAEITLLFVIPLQAAMMARGYGLN